MRKYICVTTGDAAGIGPEITVKALKNKALYTENNIVPIVIGDGAAVQDAIDFTDSDCKIHKIKKPEEALGVYGTIDLIDLGLLHLGDWQYKTVCTLSGHASFCYVTTAIQLCLDGLAHAVVTGPINKEAIHKAGHDFAGHTEIFSHYTGESNCAMLLISDTLRVIHVTTHVSMINACKIIAENPKRIENVIHLADETLQLLGIKSPRIAVAGLNAHCSENGLFGTEEAQSVIPAIEACKAAGINVEGPIPPDTVFVKAIAGKYDVVVAMYHDQGHIPLKLCGFKMDPVTGSYSSMSGVNCSVGLPMIRTSVDHGTAFGKAGEGRANEESMVEAYQMAAMMVKNKFKNESGEEGLI